MSAKEYSAGAFIYRKDGNETLFLLLEKVNGEYDMPKGHIEKGESSQQAALREIREETAIDAVFEPFFSESTTYFFFKGKERIAKMVKFFLCKVDSDKVEISKEHKGYEWCDYNAAMRKLKYGNLKRLLSIVNDYIARKEAIGSINEEYAALADRSVGWDLSRRFVPGEGRVDARLMIIGQAPGANEDEQRRPFVGRSGQLLDSLLRRTRMSRKRTYITSVVQFFPPKNRLPSRTEVEMCRPFLDRQIGVVKPKYVITLGNLSSETVLGIGEVEKNHGRLIEKDGIVYLITFHPAAALRFKENYALMLGDFKKLQDRMGKGL